MSNEVMEIISSNDLIIRMKIIWRKNYVNALSLFQSHKNDRNPAKAIALIIIFVALIIHFINKFLLINIMGIRVC